jgi:hypothetical protein
MRRSGTDARAVLDAWRARGADRLDPVRFRFLDALALRAAGYGGEARRLLDERLSRLLEAYAEDLERAADDGHADGGARPCEPAGSALAGLLGHMAGLAATREDAPATAGPALQPPPFPALPALDEFRRIWSGIRTESQLRQTLEQVPANAGPLNSGALVHRSVALMREVSPGYLQCFLSYVDVLSGMEQLNDHGALSGPGTPRTASGRKRTRDKPRKRSE